MASSGILSKILFKLPDNSKNWVKSFTPVWYTQPIQPKTKDLPSICDEATRYSIMMNKKKYCDLLVAAGPGVMETADYAQQDSLEIPTETMALVNALKAIKLHNKRSLEDGPTVAQM